MGKRTKQYKKLMRSFEFLGFRQPYQILMTSDVVLDTVKLDFLHLLEKTLSTKSLKPMITQCCIRALYDQNKGPNRDPAVVAAIERAKTFERRRCGHLMDEAALSEHECVMSVVDPKGNNQNKFRYIVATQDEELRERLRSVVPTPLMYVRRSVVILEPMSASSAKVREREERSKFKDGIIRGQKRKREEDDSDSGDSGEEDEAKAGKDDKETPKKRKKQYGPKGPNPLAVKKAKKQTNDGEKPRKPTEPTAETPAETKPKRKRRKKGGVGNAGNASEQKQAEDGPSTAPTTDE
ncbi:rRNA-processing protein utp23 [Echria macrotheca]|uniref:U three protein 23 n=1 Tax=Echria macrotheca TaxID=438768 RepID=A0AAJ0BG37_9PEZI|nr:rRNA-processing protein utp23 [Echria macrotheca]